MFQCFETTDMGAGIFTFLCFSLFRNVSKRVDFEIFCLFQFVSVVLLYYLYVSMFRNTRYGGWNFHLLIFQFVSQRFEPIESVDLEIFCLFQFVSVVLLYNLYILMFRNTRYGGWNFHLFMFQFVSKRFETIESVDLEIFLPVSICFSSFTIQSICFNVSKHQIWGLEFSPFYVSVCFATFRNT